MPAPSVSRETKTVERSETPADGRLATGQGRERFPLAGMALLIFSVVAIFAAFPLIGRNLSSLRVIQTIDQAAASDEGRQSPAAGAEQSAYLQGYAAFSAGEYALAANAFRTVAYRRGALGRWYLIRSLTMAGEWQAALQEIDQSKPEQQGLLVPILVANREALSPEDARAILEKIALSEVSSVQYAQALMAEGKHAEAEEWLASNPNIETWKSAKLYQGIALSYLRRWDEAETLLGALYQDTPSPINAMWYGQVLLNTNQDQLGIALFQEGIEGVNDAIKVRYLPIFAQALADRYSCKDAQLMLANSIDPVFAAQYQEAVALAQSRIETRCATVK